MVGKVALEEFATVECEGQAKRWRNGRKSLEDRNPNLTRHDFRTLEVFPQILARLIFARSRSTVLELGLIITNWYPSNDLNDAN